MSRCIETKLRLSRMRAYFFIVFRLRPRFILTVIRFVGEAFFIWRESK